MNKVARGKRRWVGLTLVSETSSRSDCEEIFAELLRGIEWKLYDFVVEDGGLIKAIVRVGLSDWEEAIGRLNSHEFCETVTTSGKIRLVRGRLGISRPPRRS
ncbi:uncharacterized protein METZ01_LOCUS180545 [marine metagenome]|uniref:Transcription regulator AsnC/Lrp ligand binding domain-containing protein n=1 Tax=marine metagenome TaxID=408172 RepID=A0A382CPY6_9ZZZZ